MNALFLAMPLMLAWLLTFVPRRPALGASVVPPESGCRPATDAPSADGLGEAAVTGVGRLSGGTDPSGAAVNGRRLAETARPLTKALAAARANRRYGRCNYCGAPCYGLTCRAHSDLPRLEPYRLATNPATKEEE